MAAADEAGMADHTADEPQVHDVTHMSEADFEAQHLATYNGFLNLTKWTIITIVVILILMGWFLT